MANLKVKICGIDFPNPVWTAAGPTGANADMLLMAANAGAGGLVAKTISVNPARVPIPNIASPSPGSLLNAELWSEIDYHNFINRDLSAAQKSGIPVIASVGYTPDELRILGKELERKKTADAVEFSIHYVGKDAETLSEMARALKDVTSLPVFAKLSPAVTDIAATVEALDDIVDGYVAVNSLGPALDFNIHTLQPVLGSEDGRGWLSGRAILPIGLHFVQMIAAQTKKPVIGVGGIRTAEDVIKYLMVGASAVQVCSAAIVQGESIYKKLTDGLNKWMDKNNYAGISDLRAIYPGKKETKRYYFREGPQLYPQIIEENCTFCDLCARVCMYQAIRFENKKFIFDIDKCVSCGLCTSVCGSNALKMNELSG